MEEIKQWIICIVICSLVTAIVSVLSPQGGTERALKTVVSVFMICAFLSPFLNGMVVDADFDFPDFEENKSELSSEILKAMLTETETQSETEIKKLLESLSVEFKEIKVYADINKDNEIFIRYISLSLPERFSHREKQITSNQKSMFSSEVEFIWVKE